MSIIDLHAIQRAQDEERGHNWNVLKYLHAVPPLGQPLSSSSCIFLVGATLHQGFHNNRWSSSDPNSEYDSLQTQLQLYCSIIFLIILRMKVNILQLSYYHLTMNIWKIMEYFLGEKWRCNRYDQLKNNISG